MKRFTLMLYDFDGDVVGEDPIYISVDEIAVIEIAIIEKSVKCTNVILKSGLSLHLKESPLDILAALKGNKNG